jgi:hypothetical protein
LFRLLFYLVLRLLEYSCCLLCLCQGVCALLYFSFFSLSGSLPCMADLPVGQRGPSVALLFFARAF